MTVRYVVLAEEIENEIQKLKKVESKIQRIVSTLKKGKVEKEIYLDALALTLHSFYTGLENIFENIAAKVDGDIPAGESWHTDLLIQMATTLKDIRPNVISESLAAELRELLAFRHRIRNIYSFDIDETHVLRICGRLNSFRKKLFEELHSFVGFLKNSGENS